MLDTADGWSLRYFDKNVRINKIGYRISLSNGKIKGNERRKG